ncbi:putative RNA recognition motif domain, nucleotide-binding alpha-beta plait domain superfamily [Helianthus annuus]|uniref:RNA recognition motif domain, nucleotide-binding alpha-beta plait domain superfamily n=1 Tax=Helianthus annuus TaxID=4232 RepID=A0A9K3DMG0_HELAN|nr:putative RNA recognition motif domain, nucleotide-binding alpha-beta plait domain superfamily [Helianthus annuus]
MAGRGDISKFFVSNLPEGCTPWELRCSVEGLGNVAGTFVAKKRDKSGSRFGFISFRGVSDMLDMVKKIRGIRMGDCKLKANVARFAVENKGLSSQPKPAQQAPISVGPPLVNRNFNVRDCRSYRDVVGVSKAGGGAAGLNEGGSSTLVKSIVVPDSTGAFKDVFGFAVVGRTVDLETLVDFDRLMRIAKIAFTRIQYLGGLSILVSFSCQEEALAFIDSKSVWGPWFTKLEVWNGQTLSFERVAWLKLTGIPLHLMETEILVMIGEVFGKILHVPKFLEEDHNLAVVRVGVLSGGANRINEDVSLKWKNRSFRIWVEEELDDWVPDCLGVPFSLSSENSHSSSAQPEEVAPVSGAGGSEKSREEDEGVGVAQEPVGGEVDPHATDTCMREEREKLGCNNDSNYEEGQPRFSQGTPVVSVNACPNVEHLEGMGPATFGDFNFLMGKGDKGALRKGGLKPKSRMSKAHTVSGFSPVESRPKKRSRWDLEGPAPGFGFVGFTDSSNLGGTAMNSTSTPEVEVTNLSPRVEHVFSGVNGVVTAEEIPMGPANQTPGQSVQGSQQQEEEVEKTVY